ncbi:MAG: DUF4071 domain-containing protein [Candidatus Fermentibacteraceae bacterium]|nr:DUF4071 domain-containing protein [Candidatus Fermentibacteraceae bacterium]
MTHSRTVICESLSRELDDLLHSGEYLKAYDLGRDWLDRVREPELDILMKHLICMAKLGMEDEAIALFEERLGVGSDVDPEVLSVMGGLYKRKWMNSNSESGSESASALDLSLDCYLKAHRSVDNYWPSINAATLAMVAGREELSRGLAGEVITRCWDEYNSYGTSCDFWVPASLGEAYLVTREYDQARKWYKSGRSHLAGQLGRLRSTRENARLLLDYFETPEPIRGAILDSIGQPRIAVFAGHKLDRPGREYPRFPESISGSLKKRLKKRIIEFKPDIGIASAADGSDILFHECMQEVGRRTTVVLPFPPERFRKMLETSVGCSWAERFDRIIEGSNSVEVVSGSSFLFDSEAAHKLSSDFMIELTMDMLKVFDGELVPLVLWDRRSTGHSGGTSYIVSRLRGLGFEPELVSPQVIASVGVPGKGSADSDFLQPEYEQMGIYEPVIRPLMVVKLPSRELCEEQASYLSILSSFLSDACRDSSIRVLSASSLSGAVCLMLERPSDAIALCQLLKSRFAGTEELTMILHAGMVHMLSTALTGSRDYYSALMEEALDIADTLGSPATISTMQFRSSVDDDIREALDFTYCGRLITGNGSHLMLYRIR